MWIYLHLILVISFIYEQKIIIMVKYEENEL